MKSLIKLNRVGSCMYFFVFVVIALSFPGCHTPSQPLPPPPPPPPPLIMVPFTDDINDAYPPTDNTIGWQFYISKPFILVHAGGSSKGQREEGIGRMIGTTGIETIRITAYTPGVLRNPDDPPGTIDVAFDHYEGSPTISFAKQRSGPNERYEIVFSDDRIGNPVSNPTGDFDVHLIHYHDELYIIEYTNREERPFLMVRIEDRTVNNDTDWNMTGVLVNEH